MGINIHGKLRLTHITDTEQLFKLIQNIPSPKIESFKMWLAQHVITKNQFSNPFNIDF